jgi:MraZ protein
VDFVADTPKNSPNEPEITGMLAALTSLAKHMFRGNHPTRVDEKGRLKVPAEFKRVIDEKYNEKFYITSLDGKVGQVYPFEEWERIEQKLAGLSTFNPTKKKFLDRVNYYGQVVEMDGQGRLLLPQLLREAAQLKGEVAVTGNLSHLVVRNLEAYRTEIEEQSFTSEDEKTLDDLGI